MTEKLVSVYGFRLRYGTEDSMAVLRQQRSSDKAHELASALAKDLRSTWVGADESLKTLFSLTSLDDLVQSPMASFTGFLNRVRGRTGGVLAIPREGLCEQERPGISEERLKGTAVQLPEATKRSGRKAVTPCFLHRPNT